MTTMRGDIVWPWSTAGENIKVVILIDSSFLKVEGKNKKKTLNKNLKKCLNSVCPPWFKDKEKKGKKRKTNLGKKRKKKDKNPQKPTSEKNPFGIKNPGKWQRINALKWIWIHGNIE